MCGTAGGGGGCTYIHTYIHTYTHTHIHTYTHTHIHTYTHTHIHTWCSQELVRHSYTCSCALSVVRGGHSEIGAYPEFPCTHTHIAITAVLTIGHNSSIWCATQQEREIFDSCSSAGQENRSSEASVNAHGSHNFPEKNIAGNSGNFPQTNKHYQLSSRILSSKPTQTMIRFKAWPGYHPKLSCSPTITRCGKLEVSTAVANAIWKSAYRLYTHPLQPCTWSCMQAAWIQSYSVHRHLAFNALPPSNLFVLLWLQPYIPWTPHQLNL